MIITHLLQRRHEQRELLMADALKEAQRLARLLREHYYFDALYIFGSILSGNFSRRSDIDMVIKGLSVRDFFSAYAFLLKESKYSIDLKPYEDLSEDLREVIISKGVQIG